MAASSAPRAIDPRAASCSTASDAAAACRCWASSHVSKAAPPLTVMPSSRSAPSPGRPTAAVQLPFVTTWTSTTAPGGSRSTTGSPSTDPSSPRARLISARHQRRARTGSSASANSSEASWLRAAGRSLRMRYANSPQLLRLRNLYPAAPPRVMRGRPRSWIVMLIVSAWSHGPARATTAEITAERAGGLQGRRRPGPDRHSRSRPSLAVLADGVDLVGDESVSLPVHGVRGLRVRRVDQAEDLPRLLIHPVAQVADPVLALGGQVGLVGAGSIGRRHPAFDVVHVHEQ